MNESSVEEQARADIYRLLAALFVATPAPQLIEDLRALDVADESELAQAWLQLRKAAQQAAGDDLENEYNQLFIGLGRGELMPYGSWYLSGFLMEKPLAILRDDLEHLGYSRQEHVVEPEDHIAALCEVMSLIILDPELDFATQKAFFERHLAPWFGRFFTDLQSAESANFYRSVSTLGQAFLAIEQQYFAMAV